MMHKPLKIILPLLAMIALSPLTVNTTLAGEDRTVIFYQTDVAKAGDMEYLRDSLRLMLASRLATATGAEVRLEKKMVLKRDNAFYRVKSRLVSTSGGVEVGVEAFRPGEVKPMHFQVTAGGGTELMDSLDVLVADIGKTVFALSGSPETSTETAESKEKEIDVSTSHPDRLFKVNKGLGLSIEQDDFIARVAMEVRTTERYKSEALPVRSKGMTAGDIDGDSNDEIVIASNTKIYIYQIRDQKIQLLDTISLPGGIRVHSLNAADLNNNGLLEVYVSSTRDDKPRSFVFEWSPATGVEWLYENVNWYLRPITLQGEGMVLAGQKGGLKGGTQPGIHRMRFDNDGKISSEELFVIPESVDLFNFVFADLDGDKLLEVVTLDDRDKLRVFSSTLQLLYTSPAGFGGRELSDGVTAPIRIAVTDFDNDGRQDIIVVDNELYSPKLMSKTKLYKNGQVRGLLWDIDTFIEMWSTNLFAHSVVDFQFLSSTVNMGPDVDLAGRLFIVEPEKGDLLEGFLLGRGGNRVSVYGMEFLSKRQ